MMDKLDERTGLVTRTDGEGGRLVGEPIESRDAVPESRC